MGKAYVRISGRVWAADDDIVLPLRPHVKVNVLFVCLGASSRFAKLGRFSKYFYNKQTIIRVCYLKSKKEPSFMITLAYCLSIWRSLFSEIRVYLNKLKLICPLRGPLKLRVNLILSSQRTRNHKIRPFTLHFSLIHENLTKPKSTYFSSSKIKKVGTYWYFRIECIQRKTSEKNSVPSMVVIFKQS